MHAIKIVTPLTLAAGLLGASAAAQAATYANVVSSTPVTQQVTVPRQECFDSEQVVRQAPSGGGSLIGAIVGGVVGNQFGHGVGRAAATGLGVVAGSAIGNNVEAANGGTTAVPVRRCRTVSAYDSRVVGYDVVYDYNGQRYTTRMASDPGQRLAIDVRPAGATPLDRAGPPATYGAVPPAGSYEAPPAYAEQPAYVQSRPAYYDAPAPVYYQSGPAYAPSYYYGPGAYVAPAVVGLGIGYWVGRSWHSGYRGGYHRWH